MSASEALSFSGVGYQRVEETPHGGATSDLSPEQQRAIQAAIQAAVAAAPAGSTLDLSKLLQQAIGRNPAVSTQGASGTLTLPDGSSYVGEILNGKPHGQGTLTYSPRDPNKRARYTGGFFNGLREGQGRLEFLDGKVTQGLFSQDHPTGRGSISWPNGGHYEGDLLNGMLHGQGTLSYSPSDTLRLRYEGGFSNGKREGQGRIETRDGTVSIGYFRNDSLEGRGSCWWPDGRKYDGQYRNGCLCGQGTLTWPNGTIYSGEFNNDWINGNGRLSFSDGGSHVGFFVNGVLVQGSRVPRPGSSLHVQHIENSQETCCSSSGCGLVCKSCTIL